MFVILVADAHSAAFCARVSLVRADASKICLAAFPSMENATFFIVQPGRCWISKSAAIEPVRGSRLQILPGIGVSCHDRRRK